LNQGDKPRVIKSLAFAAVFAVTGCSSLPDMRLAKQVMTNGQEVEARAHYKELSAVGYNEATIQLADSYLRQNTTLSTEKAEEAYRVAAKDENRTLQKKAKLKLARLLARKMGASDINLKEAENILQEAYREGDSTVLPLLAELHLAHPELWPQEEIKAIISEALKNNSLDANAAQLKLYKRQGITNLNAEQVIQLCEPEIKNIVDCYPVLTEIYLHQNDNGKLDALLDLATTQYKKSELEPKLIYRMANALAKNKSSNLRLKRADAAYLSIEDSYPQALIARIRLRLSNPNAASNIIELLKQAKARNLAEADLLTGKLYYDGKIVPLDATKAEAHLLKSSEQFALSDYLLGQIYLKGYLGRPDFDKALKHLLLAARSGSMAADHVLAKMYSESKGVKPNIVYAYSFARLTKRQNDTKAEELIARLAQRLSQHEVQQSNLLFAKETNFRKELIQKNETFKIKERQQQYRVEPTLQYGIKTQLSFRIDDDQYLGLRSDAKTNTQHISIKPWFKTILNENWSFFTQLDAFTATELSQQDSDQGGGSSDGYLGIRELWFDYRGFSRYPGESFRIGRQRIREKDGLWWDKDIESIRWIFDTTTLFAFTGIAQEFNNYRTDKNELDEDEKDILNLFSTVSWQWKPGHHIGSRFHYKNNDSQKSNIGTRVSQSKANELMRGDFFWLGLNTKSNFFDYRNTDSINYYAELTWLHTNGKNATLSSNIGRATIDGYQSSSSNNYSLDTGIRWKLPLEQRVHLGAAIAIGSGGAEQNTPNSFVQTGLQSNRSRFTGTRTSFHRFNEAYRAELTNLQVVTLYGTLSKPAVYDLSLVYHYFQRDNSNASIITDGVTAPLINGKKDLGYGVDIVGSYYFKKITPWTNFKFKQDASLRFRASTFNPGSAYGKDTDNMKYRVSIDASFPF